MFPSFGSTAIGVLSTVMLLGCVSLDKPENVVKCATSPEGCSDNPTSKPDASDGPKGSPDARLEDAPADSPYADAGKDASPDAPDSVMRDSRLVDLGDGLGEPDAQPDLSPDLPVPLDLSWLDEGASFDLGKSDLPIPDAVDSGDVAPDLSLADVFVDTAPLDTQPDVQTNCVAQIASNGYAAGAAPACSECHDNNLSLAKQCTGMIDCLATKPAPRGLGAFMDCQNQVAGSSLVGDCAVALVKAGCPNGY